MMDLIKDKNIRLAMMLSLVVVGATGLAFAAVPLYQIFCQVTGLAGTTQRADAGSQVILDREMKVRFTGRAEQELGWEFKAVQNSQTVKVGESGLAFYQATNLTDRPIKGQATFNVTPLKAGLYFNKIACFCFTEQTLQPGETVDMPVTYFIDPAIADDPNLDGVKEITLSYTFFYLEEGDDDQVAAVDAKGIN